MDAYAQVNVNPAPPHNLGNGGENQGQWPA